MSSIAKPAFASCRCSKTPTSSRERRLIFNVYRYFENEKLSEKPNFRVDAIALKTAVVTHVNEITVRCISTEFGIHKRIASLFTKRSPTLQSEP